MSTLALKKLIETLLSSESKKNIKHSEVIAAAREVIRSPLFREFKDLSQMTAEETRQHADELNIGSKKDPYPVGLYSFDHVKETQTRRYIFILLTSKNKHVYVKLMLNDVDHSLIYHRIASVHIVGNSTWHLNMTNENYETVLARLKKQGTEL